jgi:nucleoside transporter
MHSFLKGRLCIMMFLQFFIWGAWYATAGNFMKSSGMADLIYLAYMASPIGSIIAPFFLGMIADRFFPVQKVMGVMHLLGGALILIAPFFAEGAHASAPIFLFLLLVHMLCYMPTIGLATATAFHLLDNREREFPLVRVFGTAGWIVAGFLVSRVFEGDTTGIPMKAAGMAGIAMGFYSFTLPHIPPPAAGKRISFKDIAGISALSKLRSRPVVIFLVSILLTSIPLATYYAYAPVFLRTANIPNPAFRMTFGNMSEILFLLLMPWFLIKLGVRWVVFIGMSAWVLRYTLFALSAPDAVSWMIMTAIILHGPCYDFVYIAGQIYLDRVAVPEIRAQAQGLFVLVSYGVGQGLGTLAAGWVFGTVVTGGEDVLNQWQTFWILPIIFGAIVTLFFGFGSRSKSGNVLKSDTAI